MRNGVWSTAYWMINPPECLDPNQEIWRGPTGRNPGKVR